MVQSWAWRRGQFFPYADESATKRRRLDAAAEVLAASGNPEAAGALEAVGNLFSGPSVPVSALGRAKRTAFSHSSRRAFSKGRMYYRKFRRMRRRRWRGRRRRLPFRARVKGALLSLVESQSNTDNLGEANYAAGDGVSKTLYIINPLSNLVVGDNDHNIPPGNKIWVKGFKLRGRVSTSVTTQTLRIAFWAIRTRQFADLPLTVTTYGNTTTFNTNPTQAAGNENNIRQFDIISGTEPQVFVGDTSGVSKFDTEYVTVLAKKDIYIPPNTGDKATYFKEFGLWVPINSFWSYDKDQDTTPGDQLRSVKGYNYYLCWQVYGTTSANNILATNIVIAHIDATTYFKNV